MWPFAHRNISCVPFHYFQENKQATTQRILSINLPIMTKAQEEAMLLDDIASLAAMINKHKAAAQAHPPSTYPSSTYPSSTYPPTYPSSYRQSYPQNSSTTRFTNRSFRPTSNTQPTSNNKTLSTQPTSQNPVLLQHLVHKTPLKLVKPKPLLPSAPTTSIPSPTFPIPSTITSTSSNTTPYVRRGNKLVRKSILKKNSPHKTFILKSPSTPKSVPSSTSLKLKQFLAAATLRSAGFYSRQLASKPSKITPTKLTLATYFRHGNSLVRKTSNKYVRPGVIIPNKKALGIPPFCTHLPTLTFNSTTTNT